VLQELVKNTDIPTDTLIEGLSSLDVEFEEQNKDIIVQLWDDIAEQKLKTPLVIQVFDTIFETLLSHTSLRYKEKIIKYLCLGLQSFKEFDGEKYYFALSKLERYVKENNLNILIELKELEVESRAFVDFVGVASDKYSAYKLSTNPDELNECLASMFDVSNGDRIWWRKDSENTMSGFSHVKMKNVLSSLKKNKIYKFDKLFTKIEEIISGNDINANTFMPILDAYKILSEVKPLSVRFNSNTLRGIWNAYSTQIETPEYLEIIAIQTAYGTHTLTEVFEEKQIKIIAENIECYTTYGDMLKRCTAQNYPMLNQVSSYLTKKSVGESKLSIKEILPLYIRIKNQIQVSDQEFLSRLNGWSTDAEKITKDEIQIIIPDANFFQYSVAVKNALTDHLNKIVTEVLFEISSDTIYQQLQTVSNYWSVVINTFIDTEYLRNLPDNLTEFGKKMLDDIAAGRQTIPSLDSLHQRIIDKLDRRRTATHIKDIRNKFCNEQYVMTPQLFKYFESWFEQQGDLLSRPADVVSKIIKPTISDANCLNMIISKSDYYAKIINQAGDDATDLKERFVKILETNNDNGLIEFAKKIGVENITQQSI
jgi:hypothetical protein